jgi:hypothetical protein
MTEVVNAPHDRLIATVPKGTRRGREGVGWEAVIPHQYFIPSTRLEDSSQWSPLPVQKFVGIAGRESECTLDRKNIAQMAIKAYEQVSSI